MSVFVGHRAVFALIVPLVLGGCGCSDVEQRRQWALQNLIMTDKTIEHHVREELRQADKESLRTPQVVIALYADFTEVSGNELEVIVFWIEDFPSVDGIVVQSADSDLPWTAKMNPGQVQGNRKEAERTVLFGQRFRVDAGSERGRALREVMERNAPTVALNRGREIASEPVQIRRSQLERAKEDGSTPSGSQERSES